MHSSPTETWWNGRGDEVPVTEIHLRNSSSIWNPGKRLEPSFMKTLSRLRFYPSETITRLNTWILPSTTDRKQCRLLCLYRPPPSTKSRLTNMTFHEEFAILTSKISATSKNILIHEDLNFQFDKQHWHQAATVLELLHSTGLSQRIYQCQPTHRQSHPGLSNRKRISRRPYPFRWCWVS